MAREIKFRAWIKDSEVMIDESDYQDFTMVCNGDGFGVCDKNAWLPDDHFVIMQYTGLKDKNGVEIYEGDILKFTHDTSMLNWAVEANVFGGYSIYNLNGHPSAIRYPVDSPSFFIDREVIGNIYQNPELLNTKP